MEGEALVIANFATVFAIADDGPAFVGEMDADLVFTTSEEEDLEKGALADFFNGFVSGGGEFALPFVGCGEDTACLVFSKVGLYYSFAGIRLTFDEGKVSFFRFPPIFLEGELRLFAASENQKS